MDLLFAEDSPWVWDAETNFARLREENPELLMVGRSGLQSQMENALREKNNASQIERV
jgi:hypothetical protein